jgi:transcriptional regulator with AAA-type ATPase domain
METFDINMIKDNEIVLIIGNRGTGKTHICKQILKTSSSEPETWFT